MSSKIEWTNESWNIITGCKKFSAGCQNCYAETMHKRLTAMGQAKYSEPFEKVVFHKSELNRDFGYKKKMVFVNSMSDTFHGDITDQQIKMILKECGERKNQIFQILTKRAYRLPDFDYPPNVWLGVTVENRDNLSRMNYLKKTNAKIKFLSIEPLLEDLGEFDLYGIDWVIVGGETGKNARPMYMQWVQDIKRQCIIQNVSFFFKQWGEWTPAFMNLENKNTLQYRFRTDKGEQNLDFEEIKNRYKIKMWDFAHDKYLKDRFGECHSFISIKTGKQKCGNLLNGTLYQEMPKID